jgi:dynein light chain roadblock-type
VLDRSPKTVLQSTGSFSWLRNESTVGSNGVASHTLQDDGNQKEQGAEQVAAMVWNYVTATETLIQGLDSEVCTVLRARSERAGLTNMCIG